MRARKKRRNLNAQAAKYLIASGYIAQVVETRNAYAGVSHDLFGFIDVIGVPPTGPTEFYQVTSISNISARLDKMRSRPLIAKVLELSRRAPVFVAGWGPKDVHGPGKVIRVSTEVLAGVSSAALVEARSVMNELSTPGDKLSLVDGLYFLGERQCAEAMADRLLERAAAEIIISPWVTGEHEVVMWPQWKTANFETGE